MQEPVSPKPETPEDEAKHDACRPIADGSACALVPTPAIDGNSRPENLHCCERKHAEYECKTKPQNKQVRLRSRPSDMEPRDCFECQHKSHRRRLADWPERDECLPVGAGPQEILRHVGHFHESDFRAWVGADLKQAIREYRA
jgi:hypothetical protein